MPEADYKNRDNDDPYRNAKREWDNRLGSIAYDKAIWRFIAAVLVTCTLMSTGWAWWEHGQEKVVKVVVRLAADGSPLGTTVYERAPEPIDVDIQYALTTLVANLRTVPCNPIVQETNWRQAFAYLAGDAYQYAIEHARKHPIAPAGIECKTVTFERIQVFKRADEHWQLDWNEITYTRGREQSREHWSAIALYKPAAQSTPAEILSNPHGATFVTLNWSKL